QPKTVQPGGARPKTNIPITQSNPGAQNANASTPIIDAQGNLPPEIIQLIQAQVAASASHMLPNANANVSRQPADYYYMQNPHLMYPPPPVVPPPLPPMAAPIPQSVPRQDFTYQMPRQEPVQYPQQNVPDQRDAPDIYFDGGPQNSTPNRRRRNNARRHDHFEDRLFDDERQTERVPNLMRAMPRYLIFDGTGHWETFKR
ncbi:MAG: hypothetical protein AB1Z31_31805, partial [Desulfobacterales bacterium]